MLMVICHSLSVRKSIRVINGQFLGGSRLTLLSDHLSLDHSVCRVCNFDLREVSSHSLVVHKDQGGFIFAFLLPCGGGTRCVGLTATPQKSFAALSSESQLEEILWLFSL